MPNNNPLQHLNLGQSTDYPTEYDASQLKPVPRSLNRTPIGVNDARLPFTGVDSWSGYEISWLNARGLPQVAVGYFTVAADTPNLVESKSFKLYLNSFNETRFDSWQQVEKLMQQDLSNCAGGKVTVELKTLSALTGERIEDLPGKLLDEQDITVEQYDYQPGLLAVTSTEPVNQSYKSHLLKSNCLITNQPDWGSVYINGTGPAIDTESLLRYLISFRQHNEFHEQCVERIFQDLIAVGFEQLSVYARYTRRGGLDINPFRSNFENAPAVGRLARQ